MIDASIPKKQRVGAVMTMGTIDAGASINSGNNANKINKK
jgi:hypothetical protein